MNPPNTIATDTLVEAIARAMQESRAWPMVFSPGSGESLAQAALTAITEAGFVVCPIEPTEEMKDAGSIAMPPLEYELLDDAAKVYRAMISAAQAPHIMPPPMRDSGPLESEEGE